MLVQPPTGRRSKRGPDLAAWLLPVKSAWSATSKSLDSFREMSSSTLLIALSMNQLSVFTLVSGYEDKD